MTNPFDSLDNPFDNLAEMLVAATGNGICGPLRSGHYIPLGTAFGFYVPDPAYARVQQLATETGKVQFLGITKAGDPLTGSRDAILAHPDSAGLVAWIFPDN